MSSNTRSISLARKNQAVRVRLDAITLAGVHANAGARGISEFVRAAVQSALSLLDQTASRPIPSQMPEPIALLDMSYGPVLLAVREAVDVVRKDLKDSEVNSRQRIARASEKLEKIEYNMLVIAHVIGLIAKQLDLKIQVPSMPPPYSSVGKTATSTPAVPGAPDMRGTLKPTPLTLRKPVSLNPLP